MPFIAPLLVAAGLSATAAAVGSAVIQLGAAIGLGFLAKKLAPKPKPASGASGAREGGRVLQLEIATLASRKVIFGRAATAGSLVYWQTTGADNRTLHMVVALADHECEGLAGVWVDGKLREWDSLTGNVNGYAGKLRIGFHSGAPGQTVDTTVRDASGGRWTNDDVGTGVCYAVVQCDADEAVFPAGIPQIVFVVDGAKLYDPRRDDTVGGEGDHRWDDPATWEFSENPAIAIYNVLRGFKAGGKPLLGLNAPADAVRLSDLEAAANACEEEISLAAGGTEPRYRCGYVADLSGQPNRDTLEALIAAMAGDVICAGGIYRIMAGVARSSVASLTDADLIIDEPFVAEPRRPRSELTNAVLGSFTDPASSYNAVPLPPRTSSADEEADGGIRLAQSIDLVAVTSRTQGQRIMEIARKSARRQLRVRGTLRARWFVLEVGDWITLTSARRGYEGKVFEIEHAKCNPDLTTEVVLREVDAGIDDWTTADEIADDTSSDLPPAGPTLTAVSGLAVANVIVTGTGGAQRPGLQATWTPITDPTVVAIRVEYRKVGDTVAMERRVEDPSTGTYTWVDGIQGGLTYEIRALPVTQPERGVTWTAWVQPASATAPQKVDVAVAVPPDTVTKEMLDPQARFELDLVTRADGALGAVQAGLEEAFRQIALNAEHAVRGMVAGRQNKVAILVEQTQRLTDKEAFAQQIATLEAALDNAAAQIVTEQTVRAEADASLSSQITSVSSAVDDNTASIVIIQQSIDGIESRFGVSVNINGQVTGLIALDGTPQGSTFTVVADKFLVAQPDLAGGDAVPVFSIQSVNGSPKLTLRGDMIADGSVIARHIQAATLSAISADIGEVTAGLLRSADNLMRINLNTKEIVIETA